MADSREVMNIRQASQYLGVSPDTLYKYVYEERIPAFKLGNRWKFKKTILDSWMERKSSMRALRDAQQTTTASHGTAGHSRGDRMFGMGGATTIVRLDTGSSRIKAVELKKSRGA